METSYTTEPLLGNTPDELAAKVKAYGIPSFVGKQLAEWVYVHRATSWDDMTNISKKNKELLAQHFHIGRIPFSDRKVSQDGTVKYLFPTHENKYIEAVFIPDNDRATLCVSSQVGCKMNCLFCMTGKQGFSGHLSAGEIINQILSIEESEQLTNIVYMGMGEPLDNVTEVLRSISLLTHPKLWAWSPKRITVSTIGVEPGLTTFLTQSSAHLAVSLHNPIAEERLEIMPIQKAFPIQRVVDTIRQFDFAHQRRVTFEYIVFDRLNDTRRHGLALLRLLEGIPARVNLIRYHRIPDIDLPSSRLENMEKLRDYLTANGITATIRASRGEDILAACGMLSTLKKNNTNLQ